MSWVEEELELLENHLPDLILSGFRIEDTECQVIPYNVPMVSQRYIEGHYNHWFTILMHPMDL